MAARVRVIQPDALTFRKSPAQTFYRHEVTLTLKA